MAVGRISQNSGAWVTELIFQRLKKPSWGEADGFICLRYVRAIPGGRDAHYSYRRSARSILYLQRDKFLSRIQGSASPLQLKAQAEHQGGCRLMCYCVFMWECLCTCADVISIYVSGHCFVLLSRTSPTPAFHIIAFIKIQSHDIYLKLFSCPFSLGYI